MSRKYEGERVATCSGRGRYRFVRMVPAVVGVPRTHAVQRNDVLAVMRRALRVYERGQFARVDRRRTAPAAGGRHGTCARAERHNSGQVRSHAKRHPVERARSGSPVSRATSCGSGLQPRAALEAVGRDSVQTARVGGARTRYQPLWPVARDGRRSVRAGRTAGSKKERPRARCTTRSLWRNFLGKRVISDGDWSL